MAGDDPGFDREGFEDGVRFAMEMGLPPRVEDRPTFHFREQRTYPPGIPRAQDGRPLDPTVRATVVRRPPEQVLCAYEYFRAEQHELPTGGYRPTKVVITLLGAEYEKVKDAFEVEIGGDRYKIGYQVTPQGLFQSEVRQFVCFAKDET